MTEREQKRRCEKALRAQILWGLGTMALTLISAMMRWDLVRDATMCLLPITIPVAICGTRGKVLFYI